MVSVREVYGALKAQLAGAGVEDAGFEADVLLEHVTGRGRFAQDEISEAEAEQLFVLCAQRAHRKPLQYLLGSWAFLGLELEVGPGVLSPRPETELVCLAAAEALRGVAAPHVLDLCAGSGAIALGLWSLVPGAHITAVEKETAAFAYLERNIRRVAGPGRTGAVRAVQADVLGFFASLAPGTLDLIVCNPPYVTEKEYATLAPELYFEPKSALVPPRDTGDGLLFYRAVAQNYRAALRPGGGLVFEIGARQGEGVRAILAQNGYTGVQVQPDFAGLDRVVLATRPTGRAR